MAIEFVGSASTGVKTGFAPFTQTFSIATLSGGIGTTPQTGDIVVLLRASSDSITALSVSGYTTLAASGSVYTAYRIMGATPQTSLSLYTPANEDSVTIAMVFRGVDQTTPLDTTVAIASNTTAIPDAPAVTTVTDNAMSVVLASIDQGPTAITSPTGYSTSVVRVQASAIAAYACFKTVASAGVEDPGVFSGIASSFKRTYGVTVALRPTASVAAGNAKIWNGSAWVAKPVKVWNGSAWVTKPVKRWNGTAWVTTTY